METITELSGYILDLMETYLDGQGLVSIDELKHELTLELGHDVTSREVRSLLSEHFYV